MRTGSPRGEINALKKILLSNRTSISALPHPRPRPSKRLFDGRVEHIRVHIGVLLMGCFERRIKDVLVHRLLDKPGEFAFLTSTLAGEELAQGVVDFLGDDEIPAGGGSGHGNLHLKYTPKRINA